MTITPAIPQSTTPHTFPPGYVGQPTGEQLNSIATAVRIASVSLTTTQLLSLHTSPVQLIPAPGPNKAVVVINSIYQTKFVNSVTPSRDAGPGLWYGTAGSFNNADGGSGSSPFSPAQSQVFLPLVNMASPTEGQVLLTSDIENKPILLMNLTANMTGGVGTTGRVTALYYIVDLI